MCDKTGPCGTDSKIVRISDKLIGIDVIETALVSATATADANFNVIASLIETLPLPQKTLFEVPLNGLDHALVDINEITVDLLFKQGDIWKVIDEPCCRSPYPPPKPCGC
jgi:hypothetical protein